MGDDLKDYSFGQHAARVLFALGATVFVAIVGYSLAGWVFGL